LSRLLLAVACGVLLVLACAPEPEPDPGLDRDERRLVDAYVRLSLLEALRPDYPDSVDAVLDSLAAAWDSTRLIDTIEGLETHPFRWERIYSAITDELNEAQRHPDTYWQQVRRPEWHAPPARSAPDSTVSGPESDR
jgi:hypothetical protein